jgi:hypothetical protein
MIKRALNLLSKCRSSKLWESSADKMLFAVNAYNQYTASVKRIRNRKNPFEIQRGFF